MQTLGIEKQKIEIGQKEDEKIPFFIPVKLFFPLEPWALVFNLRGTYISTQEIHAQLLQSDLGKGMTVAEVSKLLDYCDKLSLQLEHEFDELDPIIVRGRLSAKLTKSSFIDLSFEIKDGMEDMEELLQRYVER